MNVDSWSTVINLALSCHLFTFWNFIFINSIVQWRFLKKKQTDFEQASSRIKSCKNKNSCLMSSPSHLLPSRLNLSAGINTYYSAWCKTFANMTLILWLRRQFGMELVTSQKQHDLTLRLYKAWKGIRVSTNTQFIIMFREEEKGKKL